MYSYALLARCLLALLCAHGIERVKASSIICILCFCVCFTVHVKKEPLDPQAVHHLLLTTSTTGAPPHLTPVSSASSAAHVLQVVAPQLSPAVSLAAVTASHQQHSTTNTTTSNNINTQTTAIVNGMCVCVQCTVLIIQLQSGFMSHSCHLLLKC